MVLLPYKCGKKQPICYSLRLQTTVIEVLAILKQIRSKASSVYFCVLKIFFSPELDVFEIKWGPEFRVFEISKLHKGSFLERGALRELCVFKICVISKVHIGEIGSNHFGLVRPLENHRFGKRYNGGGGGRREGGGRGEGRLINGFAVGAPICYVQVIFFQNGRFFTSALT